MKGIIQDIYVLIFLVFISRKLQLSSIEYYSCDHYPNQRQSRGVSSCIVPDLQALLGQAILYIIYIYCVIQS